MNPLLVKLWRLFGYGAEKMAERAIDAAQKHADEQVRPPRHRTRVPLITDKDLGRRADDTPHSKPPRNGGHH